MGFEDYEPLAEAAHRWEVVPDRANELCRQGRIPDAVKVAERWFVPKDAWPTKTRWGPEPKWADKKREAEDQDWHWNSSALSEEDERLLKQSLEKDEKDFERRLKRFEASYDPEAEELKRIEEEAAAKRKELTSQLAKRRRR